MTILKAILKFCSLRKTNVGESSLIYIHLDKLQKLFEINKCTLATYSVLFLHLCSLPSPCSLLQTLQKVEKSQIILRSRSSMCYLVHQEKFSYKYKLHFGSHMFSYKISRIVCVLGHLSHFPSVFLPQPTQFLLI